MSEHAHSESSWLRGVVVISVIPMERKRLRNPPLQCAGRGIHLCPEWVSQARNGKEGQPELVGTPFQVMERSVPVRELRRCAHLTETAKKYKLYAKRRNG